MSSEKDSAALRALAEYCGVESEFEDAHGEIKRVDVETMRAILAAMRIAAGNEAQASATLAALDAREWERTLPPVQVCDLSKGAPHIEVVAGRDAARTAWTIELEDGRRLSGVAEFGAQPGRSDAGSLARRRLTLPKTLPTGYHRFSIEGGAADTSLIVSPGRCWTPPARSGGRRHWGLAAQLYTVRSHRNWGIGDFSDLRELMLITEAAGGDIVGINPLHALFPTRPAHASPYSPLSRLLLNVLYIDVSAVPELAASVEAQRLLQSPAFQQRLVHCRTAARIDYPAVTQFKLTVLHELYRSFAAHGEARRRAAFERFRCHQSEAFELACVFQALLERLEGTDPDLRNVSRWPAELSTVLASGVQAFRAEQAERITELMWYQWLAEEQLSVAARAGTAMSIGLYRDLAVGADGNGAEPWLRPRAFGQASIGAPPDLFNPGGQNWGMPVPHPLEWREEGYVSFIEILRANMRHAGALRIDHAMALQHLYWIPEGAAPSKGAYVKYAFEDLLGILALESQRQRCVIVGEDLGTVPRGFRERMARAGALSYRVLFFEREKSGAFTAAAEYPPLSLAVAGNHDLPTVRGWWSAQSTTDDDRAQLCRVLGLPMSPPPSADDVIVAAHAFLMTSSSSIVMAQLDDLTRETQPVNDPSNDDHPNWQRALSMALEELPTRSLLRQLAPR